MRSIHLLLRPLALGRRSLSLKMIRALDCGLRIPADVVKSRNSKKIFAAKERKERRDNNL
jgi:hypothetical protein